MGADEVLPIRCDVEIARPVAVGRFNLDPLEFPPRFVHFEHGYAVMAPVRYIKESPVRVPADCRPLRVAVKILRQSGINILRREDSVFIRGADHFIGQFSEYERIVPSFLETKMSRTAARSHTALRHLLKFAFIDFQCNQFIGTKIHCNKILPVGSLRYKMGMRAVLAFVRTVPLYLENIQPVRHDTSVIDFVKTYLSGSVDGIHQMVLIRSQHQVAARSALFQAIVDEPEFTR